MLASSVFGLFESSQIFVFISLIFDLMLLSEVRKFFFFSVERWFLYSSVHPSYYKIQREFNSFYKDKKSWNYGKVIQASDKSQKREK